MFKQKGDLNQKMKLQRQSLFEEKYLQLSLELDQSNFFEITVEDLLTRISFISDEIEIATSKYLEENSFASERVIKVKNLSLECLIDVSKRLSNDLNIALCNSFGDLERTKEKQVKPKVLMLMKI